MHANTVEPYVPPQAMLQSQRLLLITEPLSWQTSMAANTAAACRPPKGQATANPRMHRCLPRGLHRSQPIFRFVLLSTVGCTEASTPVSKSEYGGPCRQQSLTSGLQQNCWKNWVRCLMLLPSCRSWHHPEIRTACSLWEVLRCTDDSLRRALIRQGTTVCPARTIGGRTKSAFEPL